MAPEAPQAPCSCPKIDATTSGPFCSQCGGSRSSTMVITNNRGRATTTAKKNEPVAPRNRHERRVLTSKEKRR